MLLGGGDSTTASVVTAPVNDMGSLVLSSTGNQDGDFSESSWTTLGNAANGNIESDPEYRILTNSHTPRSPRSEMKIVPVNFSVV